MHRTESKSSPRRIQAKERQRQALELRLAGAREEVIAQQLGYKDRRGAHEAIMSALRFTVQEPADKLRALDLERLDRLLLAISTKALQGDLPAVNAALAILARRAKLLGLEMPAIVYQRVDHSGNITVDHRQALLDSVATIAARSGADGGTAIPNGRSS